MSNLHQYASPGIHAQRGLTLVEILVALVISAFLIAGVIQLFVGSKQTYRGHDALSRIQENGRLALDNMARDIRMAGYAPFDPASPATLGPPVVSGNPAQIRVRWRDPGTGPLQCNPADGSGICDRTYSIVCRGGETPPCTGINMGDLMVQHELVGGTQSLIEGVADMRITNLVNSIRIDLLLVSLDRFVATAPQTVTFPPGADPANNYTAPDRRLVQVFSTTVAIRNR
ncbi:MAG: prepilin-type N-terminal cleavage/methylation domain-containing protein [Gammaproteobacteria bacterium]|nr:prepilin-type N-terminal cleavage/methylation domain-containing protein [Gammaproteobacteria bacterium]